MRTAAPVAALLFATLAAGCVSTTLRAVRDPALAGKVYEAIAVRAFDLYDPERRMAVEDAFVEYLHRRGFRGSAIPFYELAPPTRKVDESALAKAVRARGLDGILEVHVTGSGAVRSHVPRTTTTSTTGQADRTKGGRSVEVRTTTTESGGYDVYTPWMRLEVRLVDVARGEAAWVAYTTTTGAAGGASQALLDSQAGAVCGRLISDGVVKTR